jgi:hypothetical protein
MRASRESCAGSFAPRQNRRFYLLTVPRTCGLLIDMTEPPTIEQRLAKCDAALRVCADEIAGLLCAAIEPRPQTSHFISTHDLNELRRKAQRFDEIMAA